jgi:hypothetical protein
MPRFQKSLNRATTSSLNVRYRGHIRNRRSSGRNIPHIFLLYDIKIKNLRI